ncbi:hypothetical protein CCR94_01950 [Rhodoblastus sphagnicola]|uniref:Uncharacterized protein n=1 Tax=Rhodoblastus sphagnicola TaxID=333368 RepID=A0A2S6NFF5_9HYPH|nr:hypothetical protein [Rhodoblastus sphagnicola]MBB4199206.1 crossover junction endodeoxyribonuclease RuvC [Rhodoblastus sphagnicola]PPQ33385.1 hypothetical protein CCR94_01950 [Rhodoblastus sphagnicola]
MRNLDHGVIISIDIGTKGAVVAIKRPDIILNIYDMPTTPDGAKGRAAVNGPLLADIIYQTHASRAFVEFVGPRPTDGTTGAFGFGRSRGLVEGVLAAAGIPLVWITPPTWKRCFNIPPGRENKDVARARAIAHWPGQASLFSRKCDIDRAEAALIGLCGIKREG